MKFEANKIRRLKESISEEEMNINADKMRGELSKIADPSKHTFSVTSKKILGDPFITLNFMKYLEKDKKWASGIWRNDPALLQIGIQEGKNGMLTAETLGSTAYRNHKDIVGVLPKKTGTLDQIINHIGKYLTSIVNNLDKYPE